MTKNTICIDLIGIWGSGKTTIVRGFSKILKEKNIKVLSYDDFVSLSRYKRYISGLILFIKKPSILVIFFKFFLLLRPIDRFQFEIFMTMFKVNLAKKILMKEKPDVLIWEGDYHLLTMFKKMNKLSKYDLLLLSGTSLNSISYSLPLVINISISSAKERVLNDHLDGIQRFSSKELLKLDDRYSYMVKNQQLLCEVFEGTSTDYASINGKKTSEENSVSLANLIFKMIVFNS